MDDFIGSVRRTPHFSSPHCGKAQPGQVAAVSHGCPAALFTGINVLNATEEAG